VTEAERSREQTVVVDADIDVNLAPAGASDDLAETVDYHAAITQIAGLVRNHEAALLEKLAQNIATVLLALPGVMGVGVEVAKDPPPVEEQVDRIAVRIERP
jgi:dihydroneopterin aldolase